MVIIWWSKHVGVILSVLVCDIWNNVLLQTSALVGPAYDDGAVCSEKLAHKRRWAITQKKAYNIQNTAKVWN
jgi:hypothetical protein